jgi:copper chaperone CopZ
MWRTLLEKLSLAINGMSCGHCLSRVKQTLAATPGVRVDDVSIGSASVSYDAAVKSAATIADAVSAAGYPASALAEGAPKPA